MNNGSNQHEWNCKEMNHNQMENTALANHHFEGHHAGILHKYHINHSKQKRTTTILRLFQISSQSWEILFSDIKLAFSDKNCCSKLIHSFRFCCFNKLTILYIFYCNRLFGDIFRLIGVVQSGPVKTEQGQFIINAFGKNIP